MVEGTDWRVMKMNNLINKTGTIIHWSLQFVTFHIASQESGLHLKVVLKWKDIVIENKECVSCH